jgi:hypothetical protein
MHTTLHDQQQTAKPVLSLTCSFIMRYSAAAMLGGARVIEALGAWAAASGYTLSLESRFGGGLTPLHVAALLREPVEVAVALTGEQPDSDQ